MNSLFEFIPEKRQGASILIKLTIFLASLFISLLMLEIGLRITGKLYIIKRQPEAEIMEKMAAIREWGGKFVVPIPEVRVLD